MEKRYPWDLWLNGEAHKLFRNVDFACETQSLRVNAHTQAAKRGLKVSVTAVAAHPIGYLLLRALPGKNNPDPTSMRLKVRADMTAERADLVALNARILARVAEIDAALSQN